MCYPWHLPAASTGTLSSVVVWYQFAASPWVWHQSLHPIRPFHKGKLDYHNVFTVHSRNEYFLHITSIPFRLPSKYQTVIHISFWRPIYKDEPLCYMFRSKALWLPPFVKITSACNSLNPHSRPAPWPNSQNVSCLSMLFAGLITENS